MLNKRLRISGFGIYKKICRSRKRYLMKLTLLSVFAFLNLFKPTIALAKEIALTFDDAPGETTLHFTPEQRTDTLIQKLKSNNVPPVIIFANPCNGGDQPYILKQIRKLSEGGHIIGNHTCSHPRLDKVGFEYFTQDVKKAESLMGPTLSFPKLFRFPFFNEGTKSKLRDQIRQWLKDHSYRNIPSSIDNEDPIFSAKINEAKAKGKNVNYEKLKPLFIEHILAGAEYGERLALENLGYSPKHIILLHQKDATVLFIDDLVKELRQRGWTIVSAVDAIEDPLYRMEPKNTLSTFGILAQIVKEKTGEFQPSYDFVRLSKELDKVLK